LVPTNIVSSAFLSLWIDGNANEVARISKEIAENLDGAPAG
jgi:hypothetical protein